MKWFFNLSRWIKQNKPRAVFAGLVAGLVVAGLLICAGFSEKYGVIQSCTATYEAYVTAHYSERYLTTCYSTSSEGQTRSYSCTETRHWSAPASPRWLTRTVNGITSTTAAESYLGNHGFYINDIPPRDQSLSSSYHFDYYRSVRKVRLHIAVQLPDTYQEFEKEPAFYKSCEALRKGRQKSTIKLWYGHAYDTVMML